MDLIKELNPVLWLVGFAAGAVWLVAEIKGIAKGLGQDVKHLSEAIIELKEAYHELQRDFILSKDRFWSEMAGAKDRLLKIEAKCNYYHERNGKE